MLAKKNYIIILLLCARSAICADTISLGVKGGFDFSIEHATQRANAETLHGGLSKALGGSAIIYSNIFWGEKVAITPEFAMHFMRGFAGNIKASNLDTNNTALLYDGVAWASDEFSLGLMLKIYAGWFYGGLGFAATYSTAPRFTEAKGNHVGNASNVDILSNEHLKGSWGYSSTLELGFDIPAGPGRVNISSRTTVNFMSLHRYLNYNSNNHGQLRSASLLRTGVFVGYSFNLR